MILAVLATVLFCSGGCIPVLSAAPDRPNVILIITDDQGYGDIGAHGNPVIRTPNMDRLHDSSVRLTDFHVNPFCTPTRAALMTGRYASRTGAYRTSSGRTMMHTDEVTMADTFAASGYRTGMFGKWHLGDNYPHRPEDRGFDHVLWHRCGGVGQASDYWGNDYFDDTYFTNMNIPVTFSGYCTDIWFDNAIEFIRRNRDRPFFCYLSTNAPHGPYRVPNRYARPYKKSSAVNWSKGAEFYGMITNIDQNLGRLRNRLKTWGLAKNTILIFMTDNGTARGVAGGRNGVYKRGYNAGMRGKKSSIYDGGHRVPCFIRWPAGNIEGGRDVDFLTAHIDLLPTLMQLCNLERPDGPELDGIPLGPALRGEATEQPERTLFLQFQGGAGFNYQPKPWRDSVVMTDRWRLLDGKRLYNIQADPSQSNDVSDEHPAVVQRLRDAYKPWWSEVKPRLERPVRIHLGGEENPMTLTSQDWRLPTGNPPWNQRQINRLPEANGPWMVRVERSGSYRITLRQKPRIADFPIRAKTARVRIAGIERSKSVPEGATGVPFDVDLPAGPTQLKTFLTTASGKTGGAYFVDVSYLGPDD